MPSVKESTTRVLGIRNGNFNGLYVCHMHWLDFPSACGELKQNE